MASIKIKFEPKYEKEMRKAFENIKPVNSLLGFEYKFLDDWNDEVTGYVLKMVNRVIKGFIKKMGVNPDKITLKASVTYENLDLMKGFLDDLRPFINSVHGFVGDMDNATLDLPVIIAGNFVINPETGEPLTYKQWQTITDSVYGYFEKFGGNLPDEIALKTVVLANMIKKMENDGIKPQEMRGMSLKEVTNKYGKLPETVKEAKKRNLIEPEHEEIIRQTKMNFGKYLSMPHGEVYANTVNMLQKQTEEFYNYNKNNPDRPLSVNQLAGNMYAQSQSVKEALGDKLNNETFEALTRNWRRIARTENSFAVNNAYLASYEGESKESPVYMVYYGRWNPQEKAHEVCNCFLGEVARLIPRGEIDKYCKSGDYLKPEYASGGAKRAVWTGKDRVGKGRGNDWIGIPSHPQCIFNANTKITTDNGECCISDIKVGDIVRTHRNNFKKVTAVFQNESFEKVILKLETAFDVLFDDVMKKLNIELELTPEHPIRILSDDGERYFCWVNAGDVKKNDYVLVWINGLFYLAMIKKIKKIKLKKPETVYNLSVKDDESYIANGVVVHNCTHNFAHINPELDYYDRGLMAILPKSAKDLADKYKEEGGF